LEESEFREAVSLCREVRSNLETLSKGDIGMHSEQKWVVRDFNMRMGMAIDQALEELVRLEKTIEAKDQEAIAAHERPIYELVDYYDHLMDRVQQLEKNSKKSVEIIRTWRNSAGRLAQFVCQAE